MDREKANKIAKVMREYANGKEVQFLGSTGWVVADNPSFDTFFLWRVKQTTKRTVGYRDYYVQDWDGAVYTCQIWEDCHNTVIEDVEQMANFIKWKHTEWQYDDVEVE